LHRVGELTAQLGRYDLGVLSLMALLTPEPALCEIAQQRPLDLRIDTVQKLIEARRLSDEMSREFAIVHRNMQPVLGRFARLAHRTAVATQRGMAHHKSADPPLSIDALERDIVMTLQQCISLTNLSLCIQLALAYGVPQGLPNLKESGTSH
jgi:hypothetical protein